MFEESIIRMVTNSSSSATEAAKKIGVSAKTYKKYAVRFGCYRFEKNRNPWNKGLLFSKSGRKRVFNEKALLFCDTAQKAYCIGFIAADGSVNKTGGKLYFDIKNTDSNVLSVLCDTIGYDKGAIYFKKYKNKNCKSGYYECAVLTISSVRFVRSLLKYGIVHRKTYEHINYLELVPDHYKDAWLAGYIDGNGSLSKKSYTCEITSNDVSAASIQNYLLNVGIPSTIKDKHHNGVTRVLVISGKKHMQNLANLYLSACDCQLARKANRFKEILSK